MERRRKKKNGEMALPEKNKNKQKKTSVQHEFTNEKSLFQIKNGRPGGEEEPGPVWTV